MRALREESSLAEIASKYDVTRKSIQNWKKEFVDNGQSIFSKSKDLKKQKNVLNEKDEYIEELHMAQ